MNKGGRWVFWVLGILLVIILIALMFLFFIIYSPDNAHLYDDAISSGNLVNPVGNKSVEQAVQDFDESYIFYLLYSLKAYNLHNPPLSSSKPVIEIQLEDEVFNAEVQNGLIKVYSGSIENEDIVIETTREELVWILKDKVYLQESFSSGKSEMRLLADKTTLFSKGYLTLYEEAQGKGITGGVIGVYFG